MDYIFESKNAGDVTITVTGEWGDGTKDLSVEAGDLYREFDQVDGGSSNEVFSWLLSEGVEFESARSLWFNAHYLREVMLDCDETREGLLERAAALTDAELGEFAKGLREW